MSDRCPLGYLFYKVCAQKTEVVEMDQISKFKFDCLAILILHFSGNFHARMRIIVKLLQSKSTYTSKCIGVIKLFRY